MPTRFIKEKPPAESRQELTDAVAISLAGWDKVIAVRFLLTFFTSVDLKLILEELQEKKDG